MCAVTVQELQYLRIEFGFGDGTEDGDGSEDDYKIHLLYVITYNPSLL